MGDKFAPLADLSSEDLCKQGTTQFIAVGETRNVKWTQKTRENVSFVDLNAV